MCVSTAAPHRHPPSLPLVLPPVQDQAAEKEKQDRFQRLQINQLYRRLAPLEAAVAVAAAVPPPPPPPPPEPAPPPEPEVQVRLMLVHVYAQPQPTAAEIAEATARLAAAEAAQVAAALQQRQAAAAVCLQAAARGFLARRRLARQHAAATEIQAVARGMLVRRALADRLPRSMASKGVSAGSEVCADLPSGWRRQAAEQQYLQRAAAAKAKPQKRLPARPGTHGANTAVEAAARMRSQRQQPTQQPQQQMLQKRPVGSAALRPSSLLGHGSGGSDVRSTPRRASAAATRLPSNAAGVKASPGADDEHKLVAAMLVPCNTSGCTPPERTSVSRTSAARASSSGSPSSAGGCSPAGRLGVRRGSVPRLDLMQDGLEHGDRRRSTDAKGGRRETLGFGGSAPRLSIAG